MTSRVYAGFASAKTQQVISAGGAYTFGAATVGVTYSNTQSKDLARSWRWSDIGRLHGRSG